jgi:anthranilate synthase/aminodeoxychorismate synthase-like glutamine amidotransferase
VPILLIDNYDSFTYNLVQRIGEIDPAIDLRVVRNDKITVDEAESLAPSHLIISPGPCTPKESGISPQLIEHFKGRIPILGVCLGHQAIADVHGMTVKRHSILMHGKTSEIHHDDKGIFQGLPNPFVATRYHSLIVDRATVNDEFEISAWTSENEIMGLRWSPAPLKSQGTGSQGIAIPWLRDSKALAAPMDGVQFHPESFLTVDGPKLLANFLQSGARELAGMKTKFAR